MTTFPATTIDWHRALPSSAGGHHRSVRGLERCRDRYLRARHLAERFDATPLASIDPERYFDFGTTRPLVHLDDDRRRTITWPNTEVLAPSPAADRDVDRRRLDPNSSGVGTAVKSSRSLMPSALHPSSPWAPCSPTFPTPAG